MSYTVCYGIAKILIITHSFFLEDAEMAKHRYNRKLSVGTTIINQTHSDIYHVLFFHQNKS